MVSKTYSFTIKADTEAKCIEAMTAASQLVTSLTHEDLLLLAKTAKEKPQLLQTAKAFL